MVQSTEPFTDLINLSLANQKSMSTNHIVFFAIKEAYNWDVIKTRDRFSLVGRLDALQSDLVDRQFEQGDVLSQRI